MNIEIPSGIKHRIVEIMTSTQSEEFTSSDDIPKCSSGHVRRTSNSELVSTGRIAYHISLEASTSMHNCLVIMQQELKRAIEAHDYDRAKEYTGAVHDMISAMAKMGCKN